jgi:hypothetical protein
MEPYPEPSPFCVRSATPYMRPALNGARTEETYGRWINRFILYHPPVSCRGLKRLPAGPACVAPPDNQPAGC